MFAKLPLMLLAALSFFALLISAVKIPHKSVIVSYAKDTPDSVLDRAKEEINNAGGFITHEYKTFK